MADSETPHASELPEQMGPDDDAFFLSDELPAVESALGEPAFVSDPAEPELPAVAVLNGPDAGDAAPLERVRFSAPAVLGFEGYDETFEATLINLSRAGVACRGPQGLAVGDLLRLQFRLQLIDDPSHFTCRVAWLRPVGPDEAAYGLVFTDLSADAAQAIDAAVSERSEGRASEWTLPIMPPMPANLAQPEASDTEESPPAELPKQNILMAATAGLVGGVGISLIVVALTYGKPAPSTSIEREILPATAVEMQVPAQKPEAPKEASVPANKEVKGPVQYVQAPKASAQRAQLAVSKSVAPQTKDKEASRPSGDSVRVDGNAERAVLSLIADAKITEHTTFWLRNPSRLVVDLPNRHSPQAKKVYELRHPLVSRVRIGQHPHKVRFVVEVPSDVAPEIEAQRDGNALRLTLSRK